MSKDGHFARLRVCFLAGTLGHGGAERQLFYMLQALCQHGAAPRVLCLDCGEFWEESIRSLGVPVTWVGQQQSSLRRLMRVVKTLRHDPPEVFQSQHFFVNAYVALAGFLLGIKAIGAMRTEGRADLESSGVLKGWLNLHLPPLIAANSRLAIRQAAEHGIPVSHLHFLPNVVDTQRFQPPESRVERPVTLLAVGRVAKQKRFDRFIAALSQLRIRLNLKVQGWIVGPSMEHGLLEALQTQATQLGVFPAGLRFLGPVSDMAQLYRQADVCVLTSDHEGTPNVLLEAMATGLPVVATRVGGVPDIVEEGKTGFVVEREDADGLVVALGQLCSNPALRSEMGRRGRASVEARHSLGRLPSYLDELYRLALPQWSIWKPRFAGSTSV